MELAAGGSDVARGDRPGGVYRRVTVDGVASDCVVR
jgi:hypothetical protein